MTITINRVNPLTIKEIERLLDKHKVSLITGLTYAEDAVCLKGLVGIEAFGGINQADLHYDTADIAEASGLSPSYITGLEFGFEEWPFREDDSYAGQTNEDKDEYLRGRRHGREARKRFLKDE